MKFKKNYIHDTNFSALHCNFFGPKAWHLNYLKESLLSVEHFSFKDPFSLVFKYGNMKNSQFFHFNQN